MCKSGQFRDVEAALALVRALQGHLFPLLLVIPLQINTGVARRLGEGVDMQERPGDEQRALDVYRGPWFTFLRSPRFSGVSRNA